MAGPELGLAIVATVDLCFKYGKALVELCDRFRRAEIEIVERSIRIQAIWLRTKSQLDVVRKLAPILEEGHRNIQEETLKVLANKLDLTNSKLCSFFKKVEGGASSEDEWRVRSSKYALLWKNLDKAIDELEIWQRIFDPSWYLIMKAAKPQIDFELEASRPRSACGPISSAQSLRAALNDNPQVTTPIFLPSDGLESIQIFQIPYCSSKLGERHGSGRDVILEQITCPTRGYERVLKRNLRNLAQKLSHAEPITFGLLNCKGVVEDERTRGAQLAAFTMVFRIPPEFSKPRSLRSYLLDGNASHSLSDRFKLACELAKSIGYIHTFGFIHKNVLPETILLFKAPGSSIGSVSLVGFGNFRDTEGGTLRSGDSLWEKNIYRHPRRQGPKPQDDYIMQHDIYSLGVCLLELGLWKSFVNYDESMTPSPSTAVFSTSESLEPRDPSLTKEHLLSLTRESLPERMGTRYTEIVETCLTCLDEKNIDFGDEREFMDADGILVGVRYIEKVLSPVPLKKMTILIDPRSYFG